MKSENKTQAVITVPDIPQDPSAEKLKVAVDCLRWIEAWARQWDWELRKRVIKALQEMGEWNA